MILVQDDYFDKGTFESIIDYCKQDFTIVERGEKQFSVLETPSDLIPILQKEGYKMVLSFIRSAHKSFDNELRIHADGKIEGVDTDLASVFYISDESVSKNGTRFYSHDYYGRQMPEDISDEDFNNLIINDSDNLSKWTSEDVVIGIPNRMLTYNSRRFHAKFPSKIDQGTRIVMVTFYSKI